MKSVLFICFYLFAFSFMVESIYVSPNPPQQLGELSVKSFKISKDETNHLPYNLEIWSPVKSDTFSLAIFLGGWEGNLPASAYSEILNHLSSHGFVVVGIDTAILLSIKPVQIVNHINFIQNWLISNLDTVLRNYTGLNDIAVDINGHTFFLGHSAGAQMLVRTVEFGCGLAKGLVLIDPVDGVDPFGLTKDFAITPGKLVNFTTPTFIMGTGLGPVPGIHIGKLFPACAPTGLNFPRFYDSFRCSKWLINATDYGHIDFLDDSWIKVAKGTHFCATNSSADIPLFRQFTSGLVTSFGLGVIQGRCDVLNNLGNPSSMISGVNVLVKNDLNCEKCPSPSCKFEPNSKLNRKFNILN